MHPSRLWWWLFWEEILEVGFGLVFLVLSFRSVVFLPLGTALLALGLHAQALRPHQQLRWVSEGHWVVSLKAGTTTRLSAEAIRSVVQNPAHERVLVNFQEGPALELERNFALLRVLKNLGAPMSGAGTCRTGAFRIRSSRQPLVIFALFLFLQGLTVTLLLAQGSWVSLFGFALLPSWCLTAWLMLQQPLEYRILPDRIRIRSPVGWKTFFKTDLVGALFDRYFYGGCPYHVIRLDFASGRVVLDEYQLITPLHVLREWLKYCWLETN